jgi:hypothetical protein
MSQYLKKATVAVIILVSTRVYAQNESSLFIPYDCRENIEIADQQVQEDSIFLAMPDTIANKVEPSLSPELVQEDSIDGWKAWRIAENFTFGKDRGSIPMITDLNSLHPIFRDKVIELFRLCKARGIELVIVETYRTHSKQREYKAMGKKYTRTGAGKSRHQYGLAIDIVPLKDSIPQWDNHVLWKKIGITGERLGLRWGGRWKHLYDPGHFEWTGGMTAYDLASGKYPKVPNIMQRYPCLAEDLELLRKYWHEWETAQSAWTRK